MCGITGIVGADGRSHIDRITDRLSHRGPDGRGVWTSNDGRVSLGHRRLAVIDPTSGSAQPMWSQNGRYCIVFNGEIYNFRRLKSRLNEVAFKTTSDTEVLVETLAKVGIGDTLPLLNGMFAFAAFDSHKRELHLACDRLGEKPLYYGSVQDKFVFASELKSITAHPEFSSKINRDALALFLRYNYVPAPHSIYADIRKLLPAHYLTIKTDCAISPDPESEQYWDLRDIAENGLDSTRGGSESFLLNELEERLAETVASRMVSDVPLGAFLSGGYDSTLVVSMMQRHSENPVSTFSIGLEEDGYNEAVHASEVAEHLKTNHTELIISSENALALIPGLPATYCEPFADASQIPTSIVAGLARKDVTVALSGDGGDELFGGYNRHFQAGKLWNNMRWLPAWVRQNVARLIKFATAKQWNWIYKTLNRTIGASDELSLPGTKIHKMAGVMKARSPLDLYHRLCSQLQEPARFLKVGDEPADFISDSSSHLKNGDFAAQMMYLDTMMYLPGDILTKVDRATMAVSLEARVPLLDHKLVEYAWSLPHDMKVRDGEGKWALKQIVHRYVPEKIMKRPKMGFAVPLDSWLRGPLRSWAEDLLDRDRIEAEGFFHAAPIHRLLQRHLSRKEQNEHQLWSLLMFQSWHASI